MFILKYLRKGLKKFLKLFTFGIYRMVNIQACHSTFRSLLFTKG